MSTPDEVLHLPPHLVAEIEEMGRLMKAEEGRAKSFLPDVQAADADWEELAR